MVRTAAQRGGLWAEQRAERLLRGAGWRPLARRWRCRWGELDLLLHKRPDRLSLVDCLQSALTYCHDCLLSAAGNGSPNLKTPSNCFRGDR